MKYLHVNFVFFCQIIFIIPVVASGLNKLFSVYTGINIAHLRIEPRFLKHRQQLIGLHTKIILKGTGLTV